MITPAKVKTLIDKYGKTATLTHVTETYTPSTGKTTTGTPSTTSVKVIPPYPYEQKFIDGDIIKAGDMQSGISAADATPERNDTLTFGSDVFTILSVEPVGVNDTMLCYFLQLRK